MLITITSEINPILHCDFDDSALLQCRIGLISEVIVINIVNPICPCFSHFFCNPILSFFPKRFLPLFPLLFLPLTM